jgi:hypothetical protein
MRHSACRKRVIANNAMIGTHHVGSGSAGPFLLKGKASQPVILKRTVS